MIIDCIGCLHGSLPQLDGGDLLIITGDLTANNLEEQYFHVFDWIHEQKYRKKVLIAGNHDTRIEEEKYSGPIGIIKEAFDYLCDSGTTFEGLKIWGSPWTSRFEGINPNCCAFTGKNDEEIASYFKKIPDDIDILITHSPPFTIRDKTADGRQVGSVGLMARHMQGLRPKLWAFSHIHEAYGTEGPYEWSGTKYVNCSIMNERYQPVNAPVRIELSDKDFPGRG